MVSGASSELKLPITPRILPVVRMHLRELGALAKLPQDKVAALELSVIEACTNIIKYASGPDESDSFVLKSELTPSSLTVSLIDQGIPFDQSLSPECPLPPLSDDTLGGTPGSGLCLIRNLVDRMEWINHGRAGKELRLTLYDVQSDIIAQSDEEQLAPFRKDESPAPNQQYRIRRLHPADAPWVSRVVFRAYGYSYPIEELYYPESIVRLNQAGKLISVVAESEAGEIVGHCALKRPSPAPVAEVGQAVVNPAHRGRKLLQRMHAFLEEEALKQGVAGLAVLPVTSHMRSQHTAGHIGARVCGLVLGLLPHTVLFKKLRNEPLAQRESCLFYFKYLKTPEVSRIYAPEHHKRIIRKIYEHLEVPVAFARAAPPTGSGLLEVRYASALGVGEILVKQIGADTSVAVRQARRDLCELAGADAIYLQLPLAQPGAPELCLEAERDGFFFSALCPRFAEDGDALRLQYVNTKINTSMLQIAGPLAGEILHYVAQEGARVRRHDANP